MTVLPGSTITTTRLQHPVPPRCACVRLHNTDRLRSAATGRGSPIIVHIIDDSGRLVPRRAAAETDRGGDAPAIGSPQQERQQEEPEYWRRRYRQIERRQVLWIRSPPRSTTVPSPRQRAGATSSRTNAGMVEDDTGGERALPKHSGDAPATVSVCELFPRSPRRHQHGR